MSDNLKAGRYKKCGFGHPLYNQEGEYDEVRCSLSNDYCGFVKCPLDKEEVNDG